MKGGDIMYDLFLKLLGDVPSVSPDLLAVLSMIFYLFVLTEIFRFIEITVDFIFRRRR